MSASVDTVKMDENAHVAELDKSMFILSVLKVKINPPVNSQNPVINNSNNNNNNNNNTNNNNNNTNYENANDNINKNNNNNF